MFFMRQLGTTLCFIPLFALLLELHRPLWTQALLAANAFLWPFAAQYRARHSRHPARTELQNLLADAAAGVMALMFGATWMALGLPVTLSVSSRTLYATLPLISVYVLALSMVSHALSARLREKTRELERFANTDPLLNIANRRRLEHDIDAALQRFHQSEQPAALMFIDIDDFKAANDRYGHEAGDQLLVTFSDILRAETRGGDTVARFGGDEFVVLLPDTSFGRACAVADRIMAQTAQMDVFPKPALRCTLSIGIARATAEMREASQWLKAADEALYSAKREGKNRIYAL
ncbi:sensor domain-containing diguanylate cyclase [Cronobacter sakazakii]|uniref:sensor domain-containing diguanylate cyclase n=1 Tax=Cronobacter sakazakii TaxID=28141 RepID=UPI000CF1588A|nr:GGDEF domain-containing protein [Cronobacter sakazakii]PPY32569.1 diguanylate cyclase AdrA [Cronobacter sakazakii]